MLKNIILFFLVHETAKYGTVGKPGCLSYNGTCVKECPEYMHKVGSDCSGFRCLLGTTATSQRTCSEPAAIVMGLDPDLSRCDCDFPMVLHAPSGYCFAYEDCP